MNIQIKLKRQAGFSLIRTSMVVLLLSIVVGAVFSRLIAPRSVTKWKTRNLI